MTDQARKAEAGQFRGLHIPGKPLVLFNIWDAGSAKAVASAGARAIATGSWSVANANGFADGEHTPLALAIDNLRRIVGATQLPVTQLISRERLWRRSLIPSGKRPPWCQDRLQEHVGCNLEDSFPSNGKLREGTIKQTGRIRCARQAADAANIRLPSSNARTDIFFQRPP